MRDDGHGLLVGSACGTLAGACVAIPSGVQALVDHLEALADAQLAKPECASVR